MPLAFDDIHSKVNAMMWEHLGTRPGGGTDFRLGDVPFLIHDADFTVWRNKEPEAVANKANEVVSDLVNSTPIVKGDSREVSFLASSPIDDAYHSLVMGARAYVSPGIAEDERQYVLGRFASLVNDARRLFDLSRRVRLSAGADMYLVSRAMPESWWDREASQNWVHVSFEVSASEAKGAPRLDDQKYQLLRLAQTRAQRGAILKKWVESEGDPATEINANSRHRAVLAGLARTVLRNRIQEIARYIPSFPPSDRYALLAALAQQAERRSLSTVSLNVTFDYCVVHIMRDWMYFPFLGDANWYIPGLDRGAVSSGTKALKLSALPTAFVAVQKLTINGTWAHEDAQALKNADGLGPFCVRKTTIGQSLRYDGIQVIGWFLEALPDLPPAAVPVG